ncbi:hypothetical protein H8959_015002 [Pygathrix nigripes]
MGETALAGGSSSTPTPQALYPDVSCPEGLEELLSAPPPDRGGPTTPRLEPHRLFREQREQRGPYAVVGVATARAPLQTKHHAALLGSNSESWGWDIGRGKLYHQSKGPGAPQYPAVTQGEQLEVPERLLVVLDMEEGTLGYAIGSTYLGTAFWGLKGRTLYPAVSAVWGQCQVRIRYLGERRAEPHSLLHLSRLCALHPGGYPARPGICPALVPCHEVLYLLYQ